MAELLPVGLHLVAAMPGPGPVGASWRGLTQTPLRSAGWALRELGPLPGRLYLPPTARLNVILTAVPAVGIAVSKFQKQTPVYFAKTKSFYSALAHGSLPAPPEWSGWGGRGDRSHPLGSPHFLGFPRRGFCSWCGRRWVWIIPGPCGHRLVFLQQGEPSSRTGSAPLGVHRGPALSTDHRVRLVSWGPAANRWPGGDPARGSGTWPWAVPRSPWDQADRGQSCVPRTAQLGARGTWRPSPLGTRTGHLWLPKNEEGLEAQAPAPAPGGRHPNPAPENETPQPRPPSAVTGRGQQCP